MTAFIVGWALGAGTGAVLAPLYFCWRGGQPR